MKWMAVKGRLEEGEFQAAETALQRPRGRSELRGWGWGIRDSPGLGHSQDFGFYSNSPGSGAEARQHRKRSLSGEALSLERRAGPGARTQAAHPKARCRNCQASPIGQGDAHKPLRGLRWPKTKNALGWEGSVQDSRLEET